MHRDEFTKNYWRFYILLENKFIKTLNYVELTRKNFKTYSIEYAHQLLSIGSELDSFLKIYCDFNPQKRKTMKLYVDYLVDNYSDINLQKIYIPTADIELIPYEKIRKFDPKKEKNPLDWWNAYNKVKHNRQGNLTQASLENVINALSALYLIEMKYLQIITEGTEETDEPDPKSEIFQLKNWEFHTPLIPTEIDKYFANKEKEWTATLNH